MEFNFKHYDKVLTTAELRRASASVRNCHRLCEGYQCPFQYDDPGWSARLRPSARVEICFLTFLQHTLPVRGLMSLAEKQWRD